MISTLVFDIETTALEADRGAILCACYESSEDPGVIHTLRNDEISAKDWKQGRRGNDKELVYQMNKLVRAHDVIVAHNGVSFDLPFLRTRALKWKLKPLGEPKTIDPLRLALRKFRLKQNRLGSISSFLGIEAEKTPLDLVVWADVMLNGTKASMDLIVEHCIADVKVLAEVLPYVKPFAKVFDDKGSAL